MSTQVTIIRSGLAWPIHRQLIIGSIAVLILCFVSVVRAKEINIRVQPPVDIAGRVSIEVTSKPVRVWSFPNTYAGVSELGKRIERFEAVDANGAQVPVRKIAPGQFQSTGYASKFRYDVILTLPVQPSDAARISWLDVTRGLLMLGDLLPVDQTESTSAGDVTVSFKQLPQSWLVHSNELKNSQGNFVVADAGSAVFVLGSHLRAAETAAAGMSLRMVIDGSWAFSDSEGLKLAHDVLKGHRDVFGSPASKNVTVVLFPFPRPVASGRWSAETRGATVTVLMGQPPSRVGALAQLSTPLAHELFHLWIPNAVALNGDYDWFYEGFTVYQAARAAVRLSLLTFPEFLNAISRAYDGYAASGDKDRWSLIEASKRRWTTGETSVYSKAMVVAFIYDLNVRDQSKGKRSLDDVYRYLFVNHPKREGLESSGDGNAAATAALRRASSAFDQRYIVNPIALDLEQELNQFGLRVEKLGLRTRISPAEKLSGRQRDLLRQLGYNERVR